MATAKGVVIILVGCGTVCVVMIALCGGGIFLAYRAAGNSAGPEIDRLFSAIESSTFDETYETATTQTYRSSTTKQQHVAIGNAIKMRLGSLESKSMRQFNVRQVNADSFVEVTYAATFEKGSGTITAKLKQEDGRMKFEDFRVDSPVFQQDLATAQCPKCGAPHAADAKFCPACKTELGTDGADNQPPK